MSDDPQAIAARLSPAQKRVVAHDGTPYGAMKFLGGCSAWGWSGKSGPSYLAATGRKLVALGLWEWERDRYPLGYYAVTPLGFAVRAILAKEPAHDRA